MSVGAVVISCFAVTVVTHGGADEHDGRTEEVLATATERSTAFLAVALVALGGAAWLLLVTGLAMARTYPQSAQIRHCSHSGRAGRPMSRPVILWW